MASLHKRFAAGTKEAGLRAAKIISRQQETEMGMYQLVNVPTEASGLEIRAVIDGENVKLVCAVKNAAPGDWTLMASTFVGDHMLKKPDDLRKMIGADLATAIRLARKIGYLQAQAEIRAALGIGPR